MSRIFVSYCRDDSQGNAGRICDHLTNHFGRDQVFFDIDSIPPGEDFVEFLEAKLLECDIVVAIIGKHWLAARDQSGVRRLDSPGDFVRLEIAAALKRNIPVFPVLLDGADMPRAQDLPDELAPLSRQQAIQIQYIGFRLQTQLLIRAIENKRKAQNAMQRPKLFGFLSVLTQTWRMLPASTKLVAILGMSVLASVAVYLTRHDGKALKVIGQSEAPPKGGQNMVIRCIPACTADTDFTLSVTNTGPTNLSGDFPSGVAILGVLLPEPAALKSWTLTPDSNLPIPSGFGVPDYSSGDVFPLYGRVAINAPKDFKMFQSLSARAGVKVTGYNAFAFGLGSFNISGASINPIKFSGFVGASGFPPGPFSLLS